MKYARIKPLKEIILRYPGWKDSFNPAIKEIDTYIQFTKPSITININELYEVESIGPLN